MISIRKYLKTISNYHLLALIIIVEVGWLLIGAVTIILDKSQFFNFLILVGIFNGLTLVAVLTILRNGKKKSEMLVDQPIEQTTVYNRDRWEQSTIGYYLLANLVLVVVFISIVFMLDDKPYWVL